MPAGETKRPMYRLGRRARRPGMRRPCTSRRVSALSRHHPQELSVACKRQLPKPQAEGAEVAAGHVRAL